ncbi:ribonuclease P/MRP protein subunit POP5-like isoform X1 [Branchiostoma floridae]|uniref:Ribonuclease P/MRP protein subunit POP5 n=1 Tax=Branchiostoma floridae TaxID=7739 RepID=A0A9J7N5Q6_BRAFL|nr:ribonuclease P/MRP protein subunit POP5-like isoform X1 [Branchiostoma floridae]
MVRFKHRYVLAELVFGNDLLVYNVTQRVVYAAVRDIIEQLHGGYGIGLFTPGMSVKYINEYTRMVMVRCRRENLKILASAIPFIKHLPDGKGGQFPCFLRTLHVGGSIKACQKWLVQHNRQVLPTLLLRCTSEEEKSRMRKSIFDSTIVKEEPWTEGKNDT